MNKIFKIEIGNREMTLEVSDLAEQANGNVLVRYGDTVVMATAVMSPQKCEGFDFFPLTVDYEERYYAAGKIKGPRYIKRETRPSDKAICNSRLIDRAIRPLFPNDLGREVQVVTTVLSWDGENDADILGLTAASLALLTSDIPWSGPLGVVRVARLNNEWVINPTYDEREKANFEIVFAGCLEKDDVFINMIESNAEEIEENLVLESFEFAKKYLKEIIGFQEKIKLETGKQKIITETVSPDLKLEKEVKDFLKGKLEKVIYQKEKLKRANSLEGIKEELSAFVSEEYPEGERIKYALDLLEKEVDRLIHENIINNEKRPDGRKLDELREIHCQAGLLPRTHGSGLFCRGETKALSILTLGAPGDQQILEGMEITGKKRFMHHYNFPPYSSGEIKPMRGPGRREIGHGMLVEKALLPLIPSFEEFPYTMRIVTEIVSSNGSTSMASVSSSSLALMDAGVPIKNPAAGIAIGLMKDEKGNYKVLADIQGLEDQLGDMDFKVAGTKKGITAIQMDVKIKGIDNKILKESLELAKQSRAYILNKIEEVLPKPRPQLSPFAPRIYTLQINPDKIREVVGPGGKVINEIIGETGVAIDIEPTGLIFVIAEKEEAARKALSWIKNITREVKVGEIFQGKVKRILNFGAFVEILPGQEGLIHISQLAPWRVEKVEDIVKLGDIVPVKVISIDEQGRINLSLKEAQPDAYKDKSRLKDRVKKFFK
jgi:polyribonucleotide nucleotidyltransferase